jgi:NitT/TauT family transport system substrate-binding protein
LQTRQEDIQEKGLFSACCATLVCDYWLKRKESLLVALLMVIIALGGFGAGWYLKPLPSQGTVSLTIRTGYTFWASSAPAWVAVDKGYFAEEGIAMTIVRGFGASDNVKRLGVGSDPIVEMDPSLLTKGVVEQNVKAKMLFAYLIRLPWSVSVLANSSINSLKDLEGKKVGVGIGSPETLAFPALLQRAGVDINKVEIVQFPPGSGAAYSALLQNKVDAITGWAMTFEPVAKAAGAQVRNFYYSDSGMLAMGMGWAATDDFIQNNPSIARGFVRAMIKGLYFMLQNPDEAAKIELKYVPELDLGVTTLQAEMISALIVDHDLTVQQSGIGYMSTELQTATRDLAVQMFQLNSSPPIDTIFTNEFNPGITP